MFRGPKFKGAPNFLGVTCDPLGHHEGTHCGVGVGGELRLTMSIVHTNGPTGGGLNLK